MKSQIRVWDTKDEKMYYQKDDFHYDNEYGTISFPMEDFEDKSGYACAGSERYILMFGIFISHSMVFKGDIIETFYNEGEDVNVIIIFDTIDLHELLFDVFEDRKKFKVIGNTFEEGLE